MNRQEFVSGKPVEKDDGLFSASSHHDIKDGDLITMYGHTFLVTQSQITQSLGIAGMDMQTRLELNAVEVNNLLGCKSNGVF